MKLLALITLSLIAGSVARSVLLTGIVRDFTPSHPDFETFTSSETGAVESSLDMDGKPVLKAGAHSAFSTISNFAQYFRNVDGRNIPHTRSIQLNQNGNVFSYVNQAYFPIDASGYGNYGQTGHNFHFTSEFKNTFTYNGGETISVTSEDDCWIFVNGKLVVDLGGVHSPLSQTVSLDDVAASIGISTGGSYSFDIFHAQRHTIYSVLQITTTASLTSVYTPETTGVPSEPGRDAYICEVLFPDFCPGEPVPVPSRQSETSCPEDPTITFTDGGSPYPFSEFNAISFDSFSAVSGDVEGRLAVRNNLNLASGQYSVGYELRTGGVGAWDMSLPYALVVGHDANFASGQVYPAGDNLPYPGAKEDIFVGGTFTGSADLALRRTGGPCDSCLDDDFDAAQAYYTTLQNSFASVADNAVATIQYSGLTLTCNSASDLAISVTIDGAAFSTVTYYTVTGCSSEAQIVFNIGGTGTVRFSGDNIYHRQERVLYNILGSGRTVRVETEVRGSILAPNNQYLQPGMGVVKGLVIVGNIQQAHQINRVHCERPAPPPHPPSDEGLCPGFETECAGLDFPLGNGVYSFRDFNVISYGSFVANTGDIEGRLAVKYDATFGNGYSIGYELQTANNQPDNSLPYSLVAGRDVTWGSGAIFPSGTGMPHAGNREDMFVGRTFSGPFDLEARRTGGPCGTAGCLDAYFDASRDCYRGYQTAASSNGDNVAVEIIYSGLFITCNDVNADTYYVSLTGSQFSSFTYTSLSNCNFQADWFINVRGSDNVVISGDSFPAICGGVVYNVLGSGRTITVQNTQLCGHLLAPDNTLYQPGGVIVGKVVAGDVTMSLQINKQNTCPNPTTVDVPSVTVVPSLSGSPSLSLYGKAPYRAGDALHVGDDTYTVSAVNGGTVTLSSVTSQDYPEGTYVYATVSSASGRPETTNDSDSSSSSASAVGVIVALVLALLALAF